jgi:hypothetical protein
MSSNQRRPILTTKHGEREEILVESDGQTVWVNSPQGCLARFSKISRDKFLPAETRMCHVGNWDDWCEFVHMVEGMLTFPLVFDSRHYPIYLVPG